ncbi:MAG TPA: peptidoglycan-binding domain-containing protein [Bryobacteraceae bacterium]
MLKTIWVGLTLGALGLAAAATSTTPNATKSKATKKTVHSASAHSGKPGAASAKTPAAKSSSVASKSRTARTTRSKRPLRSYQQAPTPERYKEIQQALIARGYLQGEATGQWGPDSVEALRRFQTDQNLTADGKIGALSLIALGLGPKRLTAQTGPQQPSAPAAGSQTR